MKLKQDFGVSALIATIIAGGTFILIGIGLITHQITVADLLPYLGLWMMAVISAYLAIKAVKTGQNSGQGGHQ